MSEYSAYISSYYTKRKLRAVEYKGGKCIDCGYNKLYVAFDFHHRNPSEKEFGWTDLRKRSWEAITKELDKCDLLCRNCHAERHHNEFIDNGGFKNDKYIKPTLANKCCPGCNKEFKPKRQATKYCSKKCMTQVKYPSKLEIEEMLKTKSLRSISKLIGCSDNGLKKHIKKIGIIKS